MCLRIASVCLGVLSLVASTAHAQDAPGTPSTLQQSIDAAMAEASVPRLEARQQLLERLQGITEKRQHELSIRLREMEQKLNIDAMDAAGKLNAREVELNELLRRQFEIQTRAAEAKREFATASAQVQKNETLPGVQESIDSDAMIGKYRNQSQELELKLAEKMQSVGAKHIEVEALQRQRDVLRQRMDDITAELRDSATIKRLAALRSAFDGASAAADSVAGRIESLKQQSAATTQDMRQYRIVKDEEKALSNRLTEIRQQLDVITAALESRKGAPSKNLPTTQPAP